MPVVGILNPVSPDTCAFNAVAFREGLAKIASSRAATSTIESRWGLGDYLAAELAALKVAVIAAADDIDSARAAKAAGINRFSSILSGKRIELLTVIAAKARRIAMVMIPDNFLPSV